MSTLAVSGSMKNVAFFQFHQATINNTVNIGTVYFSMLWY